MQVAVPVRICTLSLLTSAKLLLLRYLASRLSYPSNSPNLASDIYLCQWPYSIFYRLRLVLSNGLSLPLLPSVGWRHHPWFHLLFRYGSLLAFSLFPRLPLFAFEWVFFFHFAGKSFIFIFVFWCINFHFLENSFGNSITKVFVSALSCSTFFQLQSFLTHPLGFVPSQALVSTTTFSPRSTSSLLSQLIFLLFHELFTNLQLAEHVAQKI